MRKHIGILIGFWVTLGIVILGIMVTGLVSYWNPRPSRQEIPAPPAAPEAPVPPLAPVVEEKAEKPVKPEIGANNMENVIVDTTLSMSDVTEINLKLSAAQMKIHHGAEGDFRAVQSGRNIPDNMEISVEKHGSSIEVSHGSIKNIFGWFNFSYPNEHYVDIYIPADYTGDLDINLSAGNLDIGGSFSLDDLEIHVSAGSLSSDAVISAKDASLTVSAGKMSLQALHTEEYDLRTSAGGLTIKDLKGSGDISSSAGEINLKRVEIADNMKIKSSAGSINIGLAGEPSLNFDAKVSAGSLQAYFYNEKLGASSKVSTTVGEGPYKDLEVSASAGSIKITKVQ